MSRDIPNTAERAVIRYRNFCTQDIPPNFALSRPRLYYMYIHPFLKPVFSPSLDAHAHAYTVERARVGEEEEEISGQRYNVRRARVLFEKGVRRALLVYG